MSINMRVFSVADSEISASVSDPKLVTGRLEKSSSSDEAELWNWWREIDFLLGKPSFLTKGDVTIEDAGWEGSHAVLSSSVPSIVEMLQALGDSAVRERLDATAMRAAGVWVPEYPGAVDEIFPEILSAFHSLRDVVLRARTQGNGLIFCRYEWL